MVSRRFSGLIVFLMVMAALAAHEMGWLDGVLLARAGATLALVGGLFGVIRLPWDLTFQARAVLAQQQASIRQGLTVDEMQVEFARKSARRALLLALTLHLVGAALAMAGRSVLGAEMGNLLAAAFLAAMALRPIRAFYLHTAQRLRHARTDAEVPRVDAQSLSDALTTLQRKLDNLKSETKTQSVVAQERLAILDKRAREESDAWRTAAATTDEKLERVLREFERTIERTQQGGEVLAGIRAFVNLVRES